jgi:hypothetical protein
MPLLQFLAYYQVLEYFFFNFSQEEAKRKIVSVLKDPTFRFDREADIMKVLSAVSMRGRGFGDEKTQLRAVLNSCLDQEELKTFFSESEDRLAFFSTKPKGLTKHKITLDGRDVDIKAEVAALVYDIRCKIVHTKGDSDGGDVELLLPFTKEVELLYHYNDLMQHLAAKVLIVTSSSLTI